MELGSRPAPYRQPAKRGKIVKGVRDMIKNEISNESMSKWHHCGAMCGGRNSGLFWGVLFIVVGLYWFGKAAGLIPAEIQFFWPIVFVGAGVWFVVASLTNKKRHHSSE
jgi:hypothetical protein